MTTSGRLFIAALLSLNSLPALFAGALVPPAGLAPGSTYRVMYVTQEGEAGSFTDIITNYDHFVTTMASNPGSVIGSLGVTWKAVVSTRSISAASHIGTFTDPIYGIDGQLITTGSAGLWSTGAFTGLNSGISINEYGNADPGFNSAQFVWTGSYSDGSIATGGYLGCTPGSDLKCAYAGLVGATNYNWIQNVPWYPSNSSYTFPQNHGNIVIYGISSQLTVVSGAPEPGTFALLGLAGVVMATRLRRRA